MISAIRANDVKTLKECIGKVGSAFDLDYPLSGSYNLLMHACIEAKPEIVQYLVDEGASAQAVVESMNPLMVACLSQESSSMVAWVVRILLEEGVVVNISNHYGDTPLILASQNGHTEVVRMLINKNASLDATNNTTGNSAIFFAIIKNSFEIVQLLLEAGASIDIPNHRGYLPKNVAENYGFQDIVDLFPKDTKDEKYQVPLNFVSYTHYLDMAPGILRRSEAPPYFQQIPNLLNGMELGFLTANFAKYGIGLAQLLTMTHSELAAIDIKLPFLRKKFFLGLFKFHSYPWKKKGVLRLPNDRPIDSFHIYTIASGHLQHLVVMRCSLIFLFHQIHDFKWKKPEPEDVARALRDIRALVKTLKALKKHVERFQLVNHEIVVDAIGAGKIKNAENPQEIAKKAVLKVTAVGVALFVLGAVMKALRK